MPLTYDPNVDALIYGPHYRWNVGYPVGTPLGYPFAVTVSFGADVPAEIQGDMRDAVRRIEFYTGATIREVGIGSGGPGEISVRMGAVEGGSTAEGYYPTNGDIVFEPGPRWPTDPGFRRYTAFHELGHSMGLKHPHEGSPTLPAYLDNTATTVMSYNWSAVDDYRPLDVHALQYLYGGQNGTAVADMLFGDDRALVYQGFGGNDTVSGGFGADAIYGNLGDDNLSGDGGLDRLFGGQGSDIVFGNADADLIYGNFGADQLFGGQGNDTLYGGQDADLITGGVGDDLLFGNAGRDTFVFTANAGVDIVADFLAGEDRLQLQGSGAAYSINGNTVYYAGTTITVGGGFSPADIVIG